MNGFDIIELPDDALPEITELDGDMRLLAELVGVRKALAVAQVFNGTPIRLYKWPRWIRRWRDKCMRRDYDGGGCTGVDLARKYTLGERQVWNILGKVEGPPQDDKQLKLF